MLYGNLPSCWRRFRTVWYVTDTEPTAESGKPEREKRPDWYWPLFVAMLAALVAAITVWPIVIYKALIP
jgi:hypothetical protein